MFFSKRGINLAKEESIQRKLNRRLLKYVFSNKDLPNKSDLKKIICKDNSAFQKSFSKSYEILEVGNILENGKLAPKLEDVYKLKKVDILVYLLANLLHEYQKPKKAFDRHLFSEGINKNDYLTEKNYIEDVDYERNLPEHLELLNLELAIEDLFNRFIFAKIEEKKSLVPHIKSNYKAIYDLPKSKQTTTELAFREILDYILRYEPSTISEKRILQEVQKYYYTNYEYEEFVTKKISITKSTQEQKDYSTINSIKISIITALEELKIIIGENEYIDFNNYRYNSTDNREFNLIKFKDSNWKMNARTKQDTIKSLIGGISDMNNVSIASKKQAMFIFDFIG